MCLNTLGSLSVLLSWRNLSRRLLTCTTVDCFLSLLPSCRHEVSLYHQLLVVYLSFWIPCFFHFLLHFVEYILYEFSEKRWKRSKFLRPCLYENTFFFKKIVCILFLERGKEGERKGEKHQCMDASHAPPTGGLATQTCAWLGIELAGKNRLEIEPVTLWFAGQCSIHWATPARAENIFILISYLIDSIAMYRILD